MNRTWNPTKLFSVLRNYFEASYIFESIKLTMPRTRSMSDSTENLHRQIEELTATLEQLRLQAAALEEARQASEDRANAANEQIAALQA